MKRLKIGEIGKYPGKKITLKGWVETIRDQGKIKFLIVRDLSGKVQAVSVDPKGELKLKFDSLTPESTVKIDALVKAEVQAPGGFELLIEDLEIYSIAETLPFTLDKQGVKTRRSVRMDYRWIDLRKRERVMIFKVWTAMEEGFREECIRKGYIQIHSPKIMPSPSESKSELFELEYFGRKGYLAQSPQFYKQMAQSAGFEGVFEIGPVFRANPSFTPRHDTEFTGYDVEVSFIDSHYDLMEIEEDILISMLSKVKKLYGEQKKEIFGSEVTVPEKPFPRIPILEAKEILSKRGIPSKDESDLSPEEEREISRFAFEKFGCEFVFITDYLSSVRPFYHMRHSDDSKKTMSYDLLYKGIEITTGAQREHRVHILEQQAREKGHDLSQLEGYFKFFRYGTPPHGGFGLGPSRVLTRILGIENVRDVTYLYRGPKRITP